MTSSFAVLIVSVFELFWLELIIGRKREEARWRWTRKVTAGSAVNMDNCARGGVMRIGDGEKMTKMVVTTESGHYRKNARKWRFMSHMASLRVRYMFPGRRWRSRLIVWELSLVRVRMLVNMEREATCTFVCEGVGWFLPVCMLHACWQVWFVS